MYMGLGANHMTNNFFFEFDHGSKGTSTENAWFELWIVNEERNNGKKQDQKLANNKNLKIWVTKAKFEELLATHQKIFWPNFVRVKTDLWFSNIICTIYETLYFKKQNWQGQK